MKPPASIIVKLVHIHGPLKGTIQEFSGPEITIGRHPSCDLRFPKDLVVLSRRHARIIREGNRFKIIDSSINGTYVNKDRVSDAFLKNGDVITLTQGGPKISFLTQVGESIEMHTAPPSIPTATPAPPPPSNPVVDNPVSAPENPATPVVSPADPVPLSVPPTPDPVPASQIQRVKAPLVIQYGAILQSFSELPVTIGTDASCDLTLSHPALAPKHVQFAFIGGQYMVKDLSGRDMLRLNGRPVTSMSPIAPEDTIAFTPDGPAFQFMAGGRMAEINTTPEIEPAPSDSMETATKEETPKKKRKSLLKSIFRR
jgi:pSer/pThr/pTyr-binding forkhead associated (FHA) protein